MGYGKLKHMPRYLSAILKCGKCGVTAETRAHVDNWGVLKWDLPRGWSETGNGDPKSGEVYCESAACYEQAVDEQTRKFGGSPRMGI